jgi:hypothetical protein
MKRLLVSLSLGLVFSASVVAECDLNKAKDDVIAGIENNAKLQSILRSQVSNRTITVTANNIRLGNYVKDEKTIIFAVHGILVDEVEADDIALRLEFSPESNCRMKGDGVSIKNI